MTRDGSSCVRIWPVTDWTPVPMPIKLPDQLPTSLPVRLTDDAVTRSAVRLPTEDSDMTVLSWPDGIRSCWLTRGHALSEDAGIRGYNRSRDAIESAMELLSSPARGTA